MKNHNIAEPQHRRLYHWVERAKELVKTESATVETTASDMSYPLGSQAKQAARLAIHQLGLDDEQQAKKVFGRVIAPKGYELLGFSYHTVSFRVGHNVLKVFHSIPRDDEDMLDEYLTEARRTAAIAKELYGDIVPETEVMIGESPVRYPGGRSLMIHQPYKPGEDIFSVLGEPGGLHESTIERVNQFVEATDASQHSGGEYVPDLIGGKNLLVQPSGLLALVDTGLLHYNSLEPSELETNTKGMNILRNVNMGEQAA